MSRRPVTLTIKAKFGSKTNEGGKMSGMPMELTETKMASRNLRSMLFMTLFILL
jgi:hypothetical protein